MRSMLIIIDKAYTRTALSRSFKDSHLVLLASDQGRGEALFQQYETTLDGILIGACVSGAQPNTMDLIRKFRETFSGPIVVVTSNQEIGHPFYLIGVQVVADRNFAGTKMRQQLQHFAKLARQKDPQRTTP